MSIRNILQKITKNFYPAPLYNPKMICAGPFLILAAFLIFCPALSFAQSESDSQKSLKEILKKEIEDIEKQLKEYEEIITSKKTETKTLSSEIKEFDTQIKKIELEIKKTELAIQEGELAIKERDEEISKIENFLSQRRTLLKEFLKEINELDNYSFLEIIFSNNKFSDFFGEIQALESAHDNLQIALEEVRNLKNNLEVERNAYEEEMNDQLALSQLLNLQKKDLKEKMEGRKKILKITQGEEKKYQNLMSEAKKSVAEIKKQLFVLEGMSITFEEALSYAKFSAEKTGVRPALLLAVLTIETKLGTDLGNGNWKKDMKPADWEAFQQICKKLNLDPDLMPVSKKPSYGWGGAMGPAQFLPRTWLLYEDQVAKITGHNPPNPWDLKDAFVATALKLAGAGANTQTYDGERTAVLKFFAGGNWNNSYYSWYGEKVMNQAEIYQEQINILEGK